MKKLCIFLTYNKENEIYKYIENTLKSLKEYCFKVIMVCNYEKVNLGLEYVSPWVDNIYYRTNKGYDSGAYKDALCSFLGWDEVYKYDELILVNDSFFGFFYPLKDSFQLMDKEKCDFWGMTGQAAGEYKAPFYSFDEHVHSYFMVFKKNVLKSKAFKSFWEEFTYPTSFREAIVKFELGINVSLKKNGFIGKSFIDIYKIKLKSNENPCYSHVYELVRNYKIPMMKKKCVLIRNIGFVDTLRTIQYLKDKNLYPTDWMITCLENQFYIPGIGVKPCNSLELFYKKYSTIYIYGAGVCGKNLAVYFAYKHWSYKGFIVTDVKANHYIDVYCDTNINDLTAINVNDSTTVNINNHVTENIVLNNRKKVIPISIQEAEINPDTGIIISVIHPKVSREIENIIEKNLGYRYNRDQLFFLSACSAIKMPDDKE